MGKLRFGVAFAIIDRGGMALTLALSPRERGQKGRDIRERGFPGGGRKRRRGNLEVAEVNYPV